LFLFRHDQISFGVLLVMGMLVLCFSGGEGTRRDGGSSDEDELEGLGLCTSLLRFLIQWDNADKA
jgi:hypothetical protein